MSKNVLEKIINNGIEYYFPEGGGGSSDLDIGAVNALIDMKLGDYDSLFSVTNGLYQILNSIDTEDEIGLSSGDTRAEIVADDTSMSLISHCYAVMCYIANSTVAMSTILADASATDEISECWNSITIIAESQLASDLYLASVNGITSLFTYQTAQDAFFTSTARKTEIVSDNLMVIVNDDTLLAQLNTDSVVQACIVNSTTALSAIAGDNDKLEIVKENTAIMNAIAVNSTALAAMSDSDFFEYILEDSTYLTTCAGSTNGKAKINSYAADDLLDPIYFWTGDLGYSTFAALAADDTSMEIVQANTQAMEIIKCNYEAVSYVMWIPTSSTVAYYPLTSSSQFNDNSGNNHNPTSITGSSNISFTTKDGVDCAYCNGGTLGAYYNNFNFSTGNNVLTWSAWCNKDTYNHERQVIATTGYGATTRAKSMGFHNDQFWTGGWSNDTYHADAKIGERALYTWTFDGSTTRAYINGELVNSKAMTYSVDSNNKSGLFAQTINDGTSQSYKGYIRDMIIENRVWSAQEISEYYTKMKRYLGI